MSEQHVPYQRTADINSMDADTIKTFIKTKTEEMVKMDEGGAMKSAKPEVILDFQTRNTELGEARTRFKSLRETSGMLEEAQKDYKAMFGTPNRNLPFQGASAGAGAAAGGNGTEPGVHEFKSLGQQFVEHDAYVKTLQRIVNPETGTLDPSMLSLKTEGVITGEVKSWSLSDLKATMTTAAGWPTYPALSPRPPVLTALQEPVVADLVPQDTTTQPAILYYEETTFTENADYVAEGATKPEASLALTLRTQPVIKIAVTLPVTDEQLTDIPQVRAYIDNRLTLMIRRKEDAGLLNGNGVAPQLQGFHTKPGIGSIARAVNEDNPDAVLRAITDINSLQGFANATGIILHPLQWLSIRTLRTTTGDYIWGHPSVVGPATLWGLPVVATAAQTAGRGLVGDFQMYSHISRRMGIRIDVGYINDDFRLNIQRIRLEERLCLEIYRAKAFEEITNLN
jgi:HK97 family phage major capsid protein